MKHPVSCMCVAIGLISDLIKDPSLTSLSLFHLEEMWHKFGAFIKKLVEHIMVNQNGIANSDQDVFLFDIFRLWRSSLKAYAEIDNQGMKGTETSAFTVLLDVIHVCLVEHFRVYSKCSIEVPSSSSSLWSNYLVRSLHTVYKLVNNSDHLWIHNLYPTVDTIIYELLSSYTSCPSKSNTSSPCSSVSYNSLVNYLTSIMKTRKAQGFNEVAVFEIDAGLPLRIIILCGLESISKLDSNNPRFWSSLSFLHKLILDMELYQPSTDHHIYEDSIIALLSEDDSQLFRALDLWIQIEDRAVSADELSNRTTANYIPNAHWLFASLAKSIDFSSYLFVDWLISPETTCLSYLVHYLRRICAENQNVHQPLEYSLKNAILLHSWPLEQLTNMLGQIAKCLKTLNESEAIAFCPKPLINRINYCLLILNNIYSIQHSTDTLIPSR
ncbi:unnamed protein product [Trichobilharzia szidati]|nr:unnamed protein product [Trichobilharzia szidati]